MDNRRLTDHNPSSSCHTVRVIDRLVLFGLVVFVAALGVELLERPHWLAEVFCGVKVPLFVLSAGAACYSAVRRRAGLLLLASFLALYHLSALFPYLSPSKTAAANVPARSFHVLFANIDRSRATAGLVELALRVHPEILVVAEAEEESRALFERLKDVYPSVYWEPGNEKRSGLAVFSTFHEIDRADLDLVRGKSYQLAMRLDIGAPQPLYVLGLHAHAPMSEFGFERRTELLEKSAPILANESPYRIAAGDLNTPMWSRDFHAFLTNAGLQDPRAGAGLMSSFIPLGPWLPITPIDHILPGPKLRIVTFQSGPDIGSDHLPVLAELSVEPLN